MSEGHTTYHALTVKYSTLLNRILTDITIQNRDNSFPCKALWDTGASTSCISSHAAQELRLSPTGKIKLYTGSGHDLVNTYLVDITLPNRVRITDLRVCEAKIEDQGFDMIIGMDVICHGDMSISNFDGKTVFSFRMPSKEMTDYVPQSNIDNIIGKKHGKGKRKRNR